VVHLLREDITTQAMVAVLVHLVAAVLPLLIIVHHLLMMVEEVAGEAEDAAYHNITKKYIL
jgi:hypothetical protein